MDGLIEWIKENWGEPLKASSIVVLALILLDKVGFTWLDAQAQKRLEAKIDALMKEAGIEWHVTTLAEELQTLARRHERLWRLRYLECIIVRFAGRSIKLRRMKQMNLERISKANLLGLISVIAAIVKEATGYELPSAQFDDYATLLLYAFGLVGIVVNRKKPKKDAFLQDDTGE